MVIYDSLYCCFPNNAVLNFTPVPKAAVLGGWLNTCRWPRQRVAVCSSQCWEEDWLHSSHHRLYRYNLDTVHCVWSPPRFSCSVCYTCKLIFLVDKKTVKDVVGDLQTYLPPQGSYWESDTAIDDLMIAGDCGFTQACTANTCNHGDCHNTGSSFACTCHQGLVLHLSMNDFVSQIHRGLSASLCFCLISSCIRYSGLLCNVDVDECANNPCGAYGTCNDEVNNFTCTCHRGYTGTGLRG